MREAIGGALLIKLVMVFIVIYVCFLAIAINYSITFRVKNQIINYIEAYDGYEHAEERIKEYIDSVGYYRSSGLSFGNDDAQCDWQYNGYCVMKKSDSASVNENFYYYKVTTYVSFDFPVIGKIMNFPVSGETKMFSESN